MVIQLEESWSSQELISEGFAQESNNIFVGHGYEIEMVYGVVDVIYHTESGQYEDKIYIG